jgi:hypothetical protein
MLAGDFEVKFNGNGNLRLVATDEESKIILHQCTEFTKQNQEQMTMICPTIGI